MGLEVTMKIAQVALAVGMVVGGVAFGQSAPAPAPAVGSQVHVYDAQANAKLQVAAAIRQARREHKRVLIDFGGNWCGDCIVLDRNFHSPDNQARLDKYYVLVHVDIGKFDKNVDLADQYEVPIKKGVPALAVVDGRGKLIYAQKNGEFESMRRMDPASVGQFLEQWKPAAKPA